MNFNSAFGTTKGNHVVWTELVKGLSGVALAVHSEENDKVWWCEAVFINKNKSIASRRIMERVDLATTDAKLGQTKEFREDMFKAARTRFYEKLHAAAEALVKPPK